MGTPRSKQHRHARAVWLFCAAVGLVVIALVLEPGSGAAQVATGSSPCGNTWQPPVEARVVDGYRPPTNRYGPGNRGLEYGTTGGEQIVAVAGGDVTFAGTVGRSQFVVVIHGNGLRSTYAYVRDITVAAGQMVAAGQPLAAAEPGFHLTARVGSQYRDPTPLLIGECFTVKLVPVPPLAG